MIGATAYFAVGCVILASGVLASTRHSRARWRLAITGQALHGFVLRLLPGGWRICTSIGTSLPRM